jgi:G3E family GTPase
MAVAETLRRLNPAVNIVTARYGHIDAESVPLPRIALVHDNAAHVHAHDEAHYECDDHCNHDDHEHHGHDHHHHHEHHHNHASSELGFTSWNTELHSHCNAEALQAVLEKIVDGEFGAIARVKGLAKSGNGWLHFDVAGGRASMTAFAADSDEQARVVAIGKNIQESELAAAFLACDVKLAA